MCVHSLLHLHWTGAKALLLLLIMLLQQTGLQLMLLLLASPTTLSVIPALLHSVLPSCMC